MVLSCLLINEGTSISMPAISEIKQTQWTKHRRQQFSGTGQKAVQGQDASKEGRSQGEPRNCLSSLSGGGFPHCRAESQCVPTT